MVKIIYCGYRGTFAAYVMAAIHVGMYKNDIIPPLELVERQLKVCYKYGEQYGNLIYMGLDENLNEVYILGCKGFFDVIKMEYSGINSIFGIEEGWYVDCHPWDGCLSLLIARLVSHPRLYKINRRLFLYWLKNIYKSCAEKVKIEKQMIMTGEYS